MLEAHEAVELLSAQPAAKPYVRGYLGSQEIIRGGKRYCIWVDDGAVLAARQIPEISRRFDGVAKMRLQSPAKSTRDFASFPHRFKQIQGVPRRWSIAVPSVSSERRPYLPVDLLDATNIVSSLAFVLYDAPTFNLSLIGSKMHLVWVAAVCGKLKSDYRYSNTLGWHTFPVPTLTEQNKADLTRCAEDILLAREAHFPATIADLYDPEAMPEDLRAAHDRNDEVLERIYIGRRFRNDTERLEKLFELYTKMTTRTGKGKVA
ncbi:MAG: type IIL restriction-modification enzyme MmeI [Novosphingobium sp.]|uniref:type IIL restriction-modification enzyme MmeI n=1 Tax=Novosphingobium sp. TaxID=1874826 RepID=UPI003019FF88